jgi:hypothetical protein
MYSFSGRNIYLFTEWCNSFDDGLCLASQHGIVNCYFHVQSPELDIVCIQQILELILIGDSHFCLDY